MINKKEVENYASKIGIKLVGILSIDQFSKLPTGEVEGIVNLVHPEKELSSVKSMIIFGYHVWDPIFNTMIHDPNWRGVGLPGNDDDYHNFYSEVWRNKAWEISYWLLKQGYDSKPSTNISLKPAAVIAGLGIKGKNTLIISSLYGPRIVLGGVLTSAKIQSDPIKFEDFCDNCDICIRACPTKALSLYTINIKKCLAYCAESPQSNDVDFEIRKMAAKLTKHPTKQGYIECNICQKACPIGISN